MERVEEIAANDEERAALRTRFDLARLDRLEARIRLLRNGRQVVAFVRLDVEAAQTCVVSLEPVPADMTLDFEQAFDPDVRVSGEFDELLAVDDEEPPEPLIDETVDLGELVSQRLGLELPPYPRRPEARIDPRHLDTAPDRPPDNPFAVVGARKR